MIADFRLRNADEKTMSRFLCLLLPFRIPQPLGAVLSPVTIYLSLDLSLLPPSLQPLPGHAPDFRR